MLSLRSLFYGSLTLVVALCPLAGSAGAAPIGTTGDIAIFRETTGGDDVPTTDFAHDFDTPVRADGVYSLNGGGNTDIRLSAGHHLVLYSSRFDSSGGSNRSEVQSQLTLDGSALPVGWSQGYIRRTSGQDETLTAGGCTHGDVAMIEGQNSLRGFYRLADLGVPFPHTPTGSFVG